MRYRIGAALAGMALIGAVSVAMAADKLRAGKAVATSFPMAIMDLGA